MNMGEKTRNANHYLNVNYFYLHVSLFEFLNVSIIVNTSLSGCPYDV